MLQLLGFTVKDYDLNDQYIRHWTDKDLPSWDFEAKTAKTVIIIKVGESF